MAYQHTVSLTLGSSGQQFDVWDEYHVTLDMLSNGSPWTFTLWRSADANSTWDALKSGTKCFDTIQLSIDDHPQLTGRIEDVRLGANRGQGAQMIISGRDLSGPAIAWDGSPKIRLTNTTITDAVQQILAPFGVTVTNASADSVRATQSGARPGTRGGSSSTPSQLVDRAHLRVGERAWQYCEKLCRKVGVMMWVGPDSSGNLGVILGTPAYTSPVVYQFNREETNGVTQGNILDGWYNVQIRDVPTDVYAYGRQTRGDHLPARYAAHVENELWDPDFVATDLVKPQPIHFHAERSRTNDHATAEAQRLLSDRVAKHANFMCSVEGHGQPVNGDMTLYAINSMCHVVDTVTGRDNDFLIDQVTFRRDKKDGTRTDLRMHPSGAIVLSAESSGSSSTSSGGGGGGSFASH